MCVPKGMEMCPGGGRGGWATLEVARRDKHMRVSRLVESIVVCGVVMNECRGKRWRGK